MKTINKKYTILAVFAFLICIGTSYATYWVYSNSITVTVSEYSLALVCDNTTPTKNDMIHFTATLRLAGFPVPGRMITLWYENGTYTGSSGVTDSDGNAVISWNATGTATIHAGFEV